MQLESFLCIFSISVSLTIGKTLAASTRIDILQNTTQSQEIQAYEYTGFGQIEQGLVKLNATSSGITQSHAHENLTKNQEIPAVGDIGLGQFEQEVLKPVVSSSDSTQLDAVETFTHISAVGDIGIGQTEHDLLKPTAVLPDSTVLGKLENVTHIKETADIKDKGISQTEHTLLKPSEKLFAPFAKTAEDYGSKLLPSQPLKDHHVLLKELFKTANTIQNTSTQSDGGQVFLEMNHNDLSNQLLDKRNPELVELGAVKGKPKVPESEISIMPVLSDMLCQACKERGDIECIIIHCLTSGTQKSVDPSVDIRDSNNARVLFV